MGQLSHPRGATQLRITGQASPSPTGPRRNLLAYTLTRCSSPGMPASCSERTNGKCLELWELNAAGVVDLTSGIRRRYAMTSRTHAGNFGWSLASCRVHREEVSLAQPS